MNCRQLGNTDLSISQVGLGTWPLGGPNYYRGHHVGWRKIPEAEALAVVKSCPDLGINFIDTADIYGNGYAETLIGRALAEMGGVGREMIVATKCGYVLDEKLPPGKNQDFSEKHIRQACDASLKRLQRDRIDLYQLHCVYLPVIEKGDAFGVLDRLKEAGKIREYGVSIVLDKEALAALKWPGVRSIQIIFNLFRQKPLQSVFPEAEKKGVGILARVPLASGLLTGKFKPGQKFEDGDHRKEIIPAETFSGVKFDEGLKAVEELRPLEKKGERSLAQLALSYALHPSAVTCAIPGALSTVQLNENAAAASLPKLSGDELDRCKTVYDKYFKVRMEKSF